MKKSIIIMIVTIMIMTAVYGIASEVAQNVDPDLANHVYGKLAVIVDFDFNENLVFVSDWNGHIWSFYGIEDYQIGWYVDLVFHDNGTPLSIYDDIILRATYERVDLVQKQALKYAH